MKLHRRREHNYVKKLNRLIALGALPVGISTEKGKEIQKGKGGQ
jgi:hypothetical protein